MHKSKQTTQLVYSAKEAYSRFNKKYPDTFSESEFRNMLRIDMNSLNIFNAKMYTIGSQPRFIICGSDLENALQNFPEKYFTNME